MNDMARFQQVLDSGTFAVTVEVNPPKGTVVSSLLESAKALVGLVHGVNVTDNAAAVMRAGSLSVCRLLFEMGHDPILQMTCRDRNKLALQSDLLGAHLLGIRNVLCLTGDPPSVGDHKDAKPVFELTSVDLMRAINELNRGRDLGGHALNGQTEFTVGAAINPEVQREDHTRANLEAKVQAGAAFLQTQGVFRIDQLAAFTPMVRRFRVKLLAGVLVLRSAKMAEYMNANIPGLTIPEDVVMELKAAGDHHAAEAGLEIAVRTIRAVRPYCDGVHIMAVHAIDRLPNLLKRANLT